MRALLLNPKTWWCIILLVNLGLTAQGVIKQGDTPPVPTNPAESKPAPAESVASAEAPATPPAPSQPSVPSPAQSGVVLTYSTLYREVPGIIDAILKQPLVAALQISEASLVKAYDVTEPPVQHRGAGGQEEAGSHAPKVVVGKTGILLWGPYDKLEAGRYLVVYRFKVTADSNRRSTLFLDVAHNACTRSGIRLEALEQPADLWQEIAVPLEVPEAMPFEFRFWPDGARTAIDRIYVFKVTPTAPPDSAEALQALPAGERVGDRTDVVRSPHTNDRGMIDISGLSQGAKVRCPYTGKDFRVP